LWRITGITVLRTTGPDYEGLHVHHAPAHALVDTVAVKIKKLPASYGNPPCLSTRPPQPTTQAPDSFEEIVPVLPIVLPVVGGVLMFLLAFIAVKMA
jgi:hypothetical protein